MFPIFDKVEVNGQNTHQLYSYLKANSQLYDCDTKSVKDISWNFAKFLVSSEGKVLKYFNPKDDLLLVRKDI